MWFEHGCVCVSQGRIACANVLSDLYAMGITECDNMLMLLSVSQKMNEKVESQDHVVDVNRHTHRPWVFTPCLRVCITGPRACHAADDSRVSRRSRGGRNVCNRRPDGH